MAVSRPTDRFVLFYANTRRDAPAGAAGRARSNAHSNQALTLPSLLTCQVQCSSVTLSTMRVYMLILCMYTRVRARVRACGRPGASSTSRPRRTARRRCTARPPMADSRCVRACVRACVCARVNVVLSGLAVAAIGDECTHRQMQMHIDTCAHRGARAQESATTRMLCVRTLTHAPAHASRLRQGDSRPHRP